MSDNALSPAFMAASPNFACVCNYRPCWDTSEVAELLATLDRLTDQPTNGPGDQRRRCERRSYSASVLLSQNRKIRLPDGSQPILHVIARNLSRSGLAFFAPLYFEPELPSRDAPMLPSESVFRDGALVEGGLPQPCGDPLWLYGTVIRARTVQHDYLDVGIRFKARTGAAE